MKIVYNVTFGQCRNVVIHQFDNYTTYVDPFTIVHYTRSIKIQNLYLS